MTPCYSGLLLRQRGTAANGDDSCGGSAAAAGKRRHGLVFLRLVWESLGCCCAGM